MLNSLKLWADGLVQTHHNFCLLNSYSKVPFFILRASSFLFHFEISLHVTVSNGHRVERGKMLKERLGIAILFFYLPI